MLPAGCGLCRAGGMFDPTRAGSSLSTPAVAIERRIFASRDELSGSVIPSFFRHKRRLYPDEIAPMINGVVMTRRITQPSATYQATQYVKAGDWKHRVRIERRDQLGVLGESLMT